MGILILDQAARAKIAGIIERAHANPVPWSQLRDAALAIDQTTNRLNLTDLPVGFERKPRSESIILGTYLAAFSIEEQPDGFMRHLSVSARKRGTLPNGPVIKELCEAFGFVAGGGGRSWLEEYKPGHHAVNIVQPIGKAPEGGHG